jgi:hypothetical protein
LLYSIQIIGGGKTLMQPTVESLEQRRQDLCQQLAGLGEFRRGTLSVNYRRCGKPNCACARPDHPGHGPQYLWNATIEGKSRAKNVALGPELEKIGQEVENYRRFQRWLEQWVEVNERLCQFRPMPEVEGEKELEQLKKKLQQKYAGRSSKR